MRKPMQNAGTLPLFGDARQQTIGVQIVHTGYWHAGKRQGPEQRRPEADGGEYVFFVRIDLPGGPAQPSLGTQLVRLTGMPDVHGTEMRTWGVRVPHTMN